MMIFIVLLLCIASSTDAQESAEQKCDNMLTSFKYLCPGHVRAINPEVEELQKKLQLAMDASRYFMNTLAAERKKYNELKKNCTGCETGIKRISCKETDLQHEGTCYFVIGLKNSYHMTYDEAVAECTNNDSSLAEIHDLTHQNAIQDYLRSRVPSGISLVDVWVGMEFINLRASLRYRSGATIPVSQFHWYSEFYPSGSSKPIALDVRTDQGGNEGLWNTAKTTPLHGAFCERNL